MSKFKVGDKVRVVGPDNGKYGLCIGAFSGGDEAVVTKEGESFLRIETPSGLNLIWHTDSLELIAKPDKFTRRWNKFAAKVHALACDKGWHDSPREFGTLISLCHSELSEALEAMREGNPASEKIPEFSGVEEELADVVIRIMDLAAHYGFDVAGAMVAKAEFNKTRSKRHGGKAF